MRPFILALLLATPVWAAEIVVPAPSAVAVAIYRDPSRSAGGSIDLDDLTGFALVTETRRVRLPAGTHRLRFEGVADGILSQSAVIVGLPQGVIEKNRDARTLSPASLIEAALGQQVTLRRTDKATGTVREVSATIVSGPNGVVLRTPDGIEALGCSALPETIVFDAIPEGLSDKPVLSVVATSAAPVDALVTLAYLARGFDWTANYVARVADDGRTLDLTGWITLANGGSSGFTGAKTQVVAGKVERDYDSANASIERPEGSLFRQCWPWDTTSSAPSPPADPVAPPPTAPIAMMASRMTVDGSDSIIVTAARREELGDLKLYTVPDPVTVAAHAQKQVLLIEKQGVPFTIVHRIDVDASGRHDGTASIRLRMKNDAATGLGEPLPAGSVAVFESSGGRSMLVGENRLRDTAVAEKIELTIGDSPDVRYEQTEIKDRRYQIRLTNARAEAANVEVRLGVEDEERVVGASPKLGRIDGQPAFVVVVPAEGERVLRYRVKAQK